MTKFILSFIRGSSRFCASTLVLVQNGSKIREVPHVVRKALKDSCGTENHVSRSKFLNDPILLKRLHDASSTASISQILEPLNSELVTPHFAALALRKLIQFKQPLSEAPSFAQRAFINSLAGRLLSFSREDPDLLVQGICLTKPELDNIMNFEDSSRFRSQILEEAFYSAAEGNLKPCEISRVVVAISEHYPNRGRSDIFQITDKFWSSILDKAELINSQNIGNVSKVLPHLKRSRDVVLKTIQEKFEDHWRECEVSTVLEMTIVLTEIDERSRRILLTLADWVSVNIQRLKEDELLVFVYCFNALAFVNPTFIKTLERYLKVRGVKIQDPFLISSISDYILRSRIRSPALLEGIGEFFISRGKECEPSQIYSITRVFGELNFHPPNGFKFFELLEEILCEKFDKFHPKEILNILLSAVYLEVYPLNFVDRVFCTSFFDKISALPPAEKTECDNLLGLFESGIRLGVKGFDNFKFPRRDSYQYVCRNFRVGQSAKRILKHLGEVVGNINRLNLDVVLSSLPLLSIYIIDIMIYPSTAAKFIRFGRGTKNDLNIAVLIHPPEHYDYKGGHLIGLQALRLRHLEKMGFKIMELNMRKLYGLNRSDSNEIKEYLKEWYFRALKV